MTEQKKNNDGILMGLWSKPTVDQIKPRIVQGTILAIGLVILLTICLIQKSSQMITALTTIILLLSLVFVLRQAFSINETTE